MTLHVVGRADSISEDQHQVYEIAGRSVVVYHIGNEFYALLNYCPHQGAQMCKGPVCGTNIPSEVYEYNFGRKGEIVRCPWHGWEFDIKTGKALAPIKKKLQCYEVVIEGGMIVVKI
ncbi:Rieske (2Fe-2S) protein [Paenibacillus oceani]|uniref:Rieske (2Fe-2S) protein n=1 Tax=Paenibacillus oceani TaxID=2772510 RepID=A0A927CAE9_9BACL|nr:Rieske (2Fe-2S) protein [Paenibacillus oceani]MBD2864404.1 Rieske (2Fe-2S) protein [Paenibacillus oceani]